MSDHTKIEWTDATWNPVTGCSVVSAGCTNCYAMRLAGTRLRNHPSRAGLTQDSKAGPVWNGQVRLNEDWQTQPLKWKRPRMIFVCAHGDLFHESVPDEWIDRVFAVMALSPQHTFQVLTKRAKRMREYLSTEEAQKGCLSHLLDYSKTNDEMREAARRWRWPLPNVWLGVSAEDQKRADERVPELLATPAVIRFVSAEPLLGPIDFERIKIAGVVNPLDAFEGMTWATLTSGEDQGSRLYSGTHGAARKLDWIIVGGESGADARPMYPDWVRAIRDQCADAGVPFFFKQMTKKGPIPDDLMVREFPRARA